MSSESELRTTVSDDDFSDAETFLSECETSDADTALEITRAFRQKVQSLAVGDIQSSETEVHGTQEQQKFVHGGCGDAHPNNDQQYSSVGESEIGTASSFSRYHSMENLQPATKISATPEQLIALDRQKRDPPSYYFEYSLNKGPVDQAPHRLRQVPSEYAVNQLSNYVMDEPSNAYKLKTLKFID